MNVYAIVVMCTMAIGMLVHINAQDKGEPGEPGEPGPEGPKGRRGHRGRRGKRGLPGDDGTPGVPGVNGMNGADGENGDKGEKGMAGPQGPKGQKGEQGIGLPGIKGAQGLPGIQGAQGIQGPKGIGEKGAQGIQGEDGIPGADGRNGTPGSNADTGTTYIRWGRSVCPTGATIVYSGIAGGAHYTHPGGGADKLCLHLDPQYGTVKTGGQKYVALMYGAEYETLPNDRVPFPGKNGALHDQDVPCVVCCIPRAKVLMIPARTSCPSGWNREYWGYLMSEIITHHRSSWDCVDSNPETRPSGSANHDGALFYMTESRCGSLPCPPYKDGHELTCVVCSQ